MPSASSARSRSRSATRVARGSGPGAGMAASYRRLGGLPSALGYPAGTMTDDTSTGSAPSRSTSTDPTIAIDPVCGMEVDTTTSDLKLEHDGQTYWFCGRGCLLEFRDDPERFL